MLPRLDANQASAVRYGGAAPAEARPQPPPQLARPRGHIVADISSRLTLETRANKGLYRAEADETARILSQCAQVAAERKAEEREVARAKRRAKKASMKPPNPFTNWPQPEWKDAGASLLPPIPSVASLNRKPWLPAVQNTDENSPVEQLKRSLARSFTRVVALFRKWDVDCDGNVSVNELRDAIGALRLHETATTWNADTMNALFQALDTNGNGLIDFQELHHALRRYNPPPFNPNTPSTAGAPSGAPQWRWCAWCMEDVVAAARPIKTPSGERGGSVSGSGASPRAGPHRAWAPPSGRRVTRTCGTNVPHAAVHSLRGGQRSQSRPPGGSHGPLAWQGRQLQGCASQRGNPEPSAEKGVREWVPRVGRHVSLQRLTCLPHAGLAPAL